MWPFTKKKIKKRKYEGASLGRRTKGWITGGGDANDQINGDLPWLRERSRYLRRNNPYAHKGIELITNNVVGKGIMTQINSDPAQELWKEWAETTACDWDGRHNLAGLQRIIMDAVVESGECLVRKRFTNNPRLPIQYQILESDFLNTNLIDGKRPGADNYIVQGVEFDPNGKRVGYHLYESHPGSISTSFNSLRSNLIPASEVYHLYRLERPGQVRGVPWLSNCMIRLKDLDAFEDAQLHRAKIASLFVAFVSDISDNVDCDDESDLGERMVPGLIEHLPPGKSIDFANPPSFDLYKDYVNSNLRAIAAGLGITFEGLTGDLSQVNFSSARMGWIEMGRNIDSWRKHIMMGQFLHGVESDFQLIMRLNGLPINGLVFDHIPPRRELIDPEKEIKAMKAAVRSGFESRKSVVQSLGRDPDLVLDQIAEDNNKIDELGLVLDSDPRNTNNLGRQETIQDGSEEN